jgi:N6-adenosine-specific RNA methylase IME4
MEDPLIRNIHVVRADPPWTFNDDLTMDPDIKRGSASNYDCMSFMDICEFFRKEEYDKMMAPDSILSLDTTSTALLEGHAAVVCRAWGYTPKGLITWAKGRETDIGLKLRMGLGHYTRGVTEHMILATKGEVGWLIKDHGIMNYFETGVAFLGAPGRHSEKPEESFQLIERLVRGPYLELFARKRREGWIQFGKELV